jgi:H+/Na+-translocating ferredoxin:NAD+ oxidoreductase subunit B
VTFVCASPRADRITTRRRDDRWSRPPVRIIQAACISCDACRRACPPAFGAVVARPTGAVVIAELCSACRACIPVCPVDCIVDDPGWTPAPDAWWRAVDPASSEGAVTVRS